MRFTIRDLIWLTVVVALGVAMGVGWWFDRWSLWASGYMAHLKSEAAKGELDELIEGLETLPEEQLKNVREHLTTRRQLITSEPAPDPPSE